MTPRRTALTVSGIGALCAALLALAGPDELLRSWLPVWLFLLGLALGSLGILITHRLTGGSWGEPVWPALAPVAATFPLVALLGLPIIVHPAALYPWAAGAADAHQPLMGGVRWLSHGFFALRFVIYMALFGLFGRGFLAASLGGRLARARRLAAGGAIVYALLITLVGYDYVTGLDARYASSTVGFLLGSAELLSAMALAAFVATHGTATPRQLSDLGNLLLAFLMTFTYIVFTEFLIVWAGDLPRGIGWYLARSRGGWAALAEALAAVHFAIPFLLLLQRPVKRGRYLATVAAMLLAGQLLFLFWLTVPSFRPHFAFRLMDLAVAAALGGVWWAFYLTRRDQYLETQRG